MPLLRYFVVVGSCLTALMLALSVVLPDPDAAKVQPAAQPVVTLPGASSALSIRTADAVAKPVVIDTTLPTITGTAPNLQTASAEPKRTANTDAYAQLLPPFAKPAVQPKPRKKVVRRREPALNGPAVAGLFTYSTW